MARLNISTAVTNLWLFSRIATAQHYPRNTALNGTTTKASPTTTSSSSGSVTSSFSDITGPFILAHSSTWIQVIVPTTVGTVMVTVNEATNQTFSTTIYHTDYERNGSATLLTRTDTDAAGTVTQVVTDEYSRTMAITYPTNYFEVADSLTWEAILPTMVDNSTCCFATSTLSATPTHTPFVQIGSLDTKDPRGWLYSLVGVDNGFDNTVLGSTEVSSLWPGQTLSIDYGGCPYTKCHLHVTTVSPATVVQFQPGAILATSTTTISSLPAGGSTSPKPASSLPATPPATSTATPEQTSTTQSAGDENTSPGNTQHASSTPQSTQVSGAPPQSSATQNPQSQSQQASNTRPQSGSANSNPAQTPGGSTATPNSAPSSNFVTTIVAVQTSGSNTVVVVGGSISSTLTPAAASAPAVTPALAITIGSSTISANSASQYIIAGQTLIPGSSITLGSGISTTVIALQTSNSNTVLVVGSSSSTLVKAVTTMPPPITVGSSVITADSASHYVIADQTLAPGGSGIVVGGTTISLASGGMQLIEGTKTIAEATGIGGVIWSILGGGATGTATGNAVERTGSLNSSTGPTFQQSSGVARIRPFWAAVVIPAALFLRL
ncbi:uncharacterized protein PAC_04788 [Phialocephala subalpina]|uniref:Uncharacterized protein n=1 Tax=Phialocephala subalpina TaxID=576137 RepID=A0A1L7WQ56_9HELO|nr:uncharacterized protein PAC_04788 [Phialocephala subalpina]